jgi:hypothetical protein
MSTESSRKDEGAKVRETKNLSLRALRPFDSAQDRLGARKIFLTVFELVILIKLAYVSRHAIRAFLFAVIASRYASRGSGTVSDDC